MPPKEITGDQAATTHKRAPKVSQINRTTRSVMEATVELLGEVGYRTLTIDLISKRSGVTRSTIYRHWNNVQELTREAFDVAIGPNPEVEETGDIRRDLLTMSLHLANSLGGSVWGGALPALIEASHNDSKFSGLVGQMAEARRRNTCVMLQRAIDRGELKEDAQVDWMIDAIAGPLYHRLLISGKSVTDPKFVAALVDGVLAINLSDN